MLAEVVKSSGNVCLQYFVFTDGMNTYTFGEYSNSVFYESESFILDVYNKKHFICSSKWRADALGGAITHASVFKIDSENATVFFDEEFAEIKGVDDDKNIAYVSFYKEAEPGNSLKSQGVLFDTGDDIQLFYSSNKRLIHPMNITHCINSHNNLIFIFLLTKFYDFLRDKQ